MIYVLLADEVDAKEIRLPSDEQQINIEEQLNIDVNLSMEQNQGIPSARGFSGGEVSRAIGNNTPGTAINLPSSYFGLTLSNLATNNSDWYSFDATSSGKTTIVFSQQPSGQYAILLYKLDATGTLLEGVEYSAYTGTFQQIDYLATEGRYYLEMRPLTAPTTSYNYQFEVYVSYGADSYELNESYDYAKSFTNSMNISANIDNPYDEDWYKLTLTSQKNLDITATFAQKNAYAIFLYDSSFNSKGSFYIDGGTRSIALSAGTYYVRAVDMIGYYSDVKYTLKITEYVPPEQTLGTITIPYQKFYSPYLYAGGEMAFAPNGKLVVDMDVFEQYYGDKSRFVVMIDIKWKGEPNYQRYEEMIFLQGMGQQRVIDFPNLQEGYCKLTFVADLDVTVQGTIKSMSR